tara:strand:- start:51 stop:233 length:183 start_codon:yes stop_codon:yes gene_type:complete
MALKEAPVHTTGTIVVADKDNNMIHCNYDEAQKKVNDGWTVRMNKSGKKLAKAAKKTAKK